MEKKFINWGIMGCAAIADSAVIPGIKDSNNGRLYAIASRNKENFSNLAKNIIL